MSIFNQNIKSPLEVKVEWVRNTSTPPLTLSISALMLNKDDVINKLEDFVFYGSPNNGSDIISSDKSITCDALNFDKGFGTESSYKMNLELGKVSNTIDRINIVVSINTKANDTHLPAFDSLTKATFSIKDAAGLTFTTELNKTGESSCRCITVGLVRRYAQSWRFEEEMELKLGGLELVYNEYMSDSIINSNPFSSIGDLTIIENKYKETVRKTKITKDGTKNIIERTVEVISTKIGQLTGKEEPRKPWKDHRPKGNRVQPTESEQVYEVEHKEKPWKKNIRPAAVVSDNVQPVESSEIPKQLDSNKKPWKRGRVIQQVDTSNVAVEQVVNVETNDVPKRKFPKVKRPTVEVEQKGKVETPKAPTSSTKRKFPKVKKNS